MTFQVIKYCHLYERDIHFDNHDLKLSAKVWIFFRTYINVQSYRHIILSLCIMFVFAFVYRYE